MKANGTMVLLAYIALNLEYENHVQGDGLVYNKTISHFDGTSSGFYFWLIFFANDVIR